jgi:hypothetical protein
MRIRAMIFAFLSTLPVSGWADDLPAHLNVSGEPDPVWATVGELRNMTNRSSKAGYGLRSTYYTMAHDPGFDLASANLLVSRGHGINHTSFMSQWLVAICPDEAAAWSCISSEMNPVNRGDDQGWHPVRWGIPRLTGGVQVVPETNTFGEPGLGNNVLFGFAVAQSAAPNKAGNHARTYNGLLVEQDSIGPDGRGVFLGGTTESVVAKMPYAPLQVDQTWRHGLDTTTAKFADGTALHIGTGQAIALTTDGAVTVRFDTSEHRVVISNGTKRLFSIDTANGDIVAAGKIVQGGSP